MVLISISLSVTEDRPDLTAITASPSSNLFRNVVGSFKKNNNDSIKALSFHKTDAPIENGVNGTYSSSMKVQLLYSEAAIKCFNFLLAVFVDLVIFRI